MITLKDLKDRLKTEDSIVINNMLHNLIYNEHYPFRERTHIIITNPEEVQYRLPKTLGSIKSITCNSERLIPTKDYKESTYTIQFKRDISIGKNVIAINYYTDAVGEDSEGNELINLKNDTDTLLVPSYLEELFMVVLETEMTTRKAIDIFKKYAGVK